jgi:hypothetical protein
VRVVWLLEVVVEDGLGDQLRLVPPVLVQLCAPVVAQRIQSGGVLVQRVLVRALIEQRLQSWVLLSCLDAANDLADVVLEGCWLAACVRGGEWSCSDLLRVAVLDICLQRLNESLIVSKSRTSLAGS